MKLKELEEAFLEATWGLLEASPCAMCGGNPFENEQNARSVAHFLAELTKRYVEDQRSGHHMKVEKAVEKAHKATKRHFRDQTIEDLAKEMGISAPALEYGRDLEAPVPGHPPSTQSEHPEGPTPEPTNESGPPYSQSETPAQDPEPETRDLARDDTPPPPAEASDPDSSKSPHQEPDRSSDPKARPAQSHTPPPESHPPEDPEASPPPESPPSEETSMPPQDQTSEGQVS